MWLSIGCVRTKCKKKKKCLTHKKTEQPTRKCNGKKSNSKWINRNDGQPRVHRWWKTKQTNKPFKLGPPSMRAIKSDRAHFSVSLNLETGCKPDDAYRDKCALRAQTPNHRNWNLVLLFCPLSFYILTSFSTWLTLLLRHGVLCCVGETLWLNDSQCTSAAPTNYSSEQNRFK